MNQGPAYCRPWFLFAERGMPRIILEGVYARYKAGGYGKADTGVEYFARLVERLAEAAEAAEHSD